MGDVLAYSTGDPTMRTMARFLPAAALLVHSVATAAPQPESSILPSVGDPTTVLVFARTDCPITNRYAPELRRLHDRFAGRGVRFFLVYPDPAETDAGVQRHAGDFGFGMAAVRDPKHALVRLTGAHTTPEAAVFVGDPAGPRLVYRGRIDDRNVAPGKTRPSPRTRDLEDVLTALGQGQIVPTRTTTAIGCAIAPLE